ncbi:MAG: hypothetical protein ABUM51_10040, partial [Bacteroidota bacterium]
MERLQELITQLKEQFDRKVDPLQMLLTARLLDAELTRLSSYAAANRGSAKVAVMMPSSMKIYTGQSAMQEFRSAAPDSRNEPRNGSQTNGAAVTGAPTGNGLSPEQEFIPAQKTAAELRASSDGKPASEARPASEERWNPESRYAAEEKRAAESRYAAEEKRAAESRPPAEEKWAPEPRTASEEKWAPEPRVAADLKVVAPARPAAATATKESERGPWPYDPLAEIPTLAQQQKPPRELNDVIGANGLSPSLNDKLKVNVLDLSAALNDTPVRDLKKAIGVNDRYVFISQLFRGDEVMYERSIKTINGF